MTAPIRVLTYSRVSTAHHEQKPEVQVNELRRYCAARGWEIAHEVVDHGYTGSSDTRPGLKELLALARAREIDAVVVVKLDRLFRSLKHLLTVLDEFQALGIVFVAVKDQVDYSTPAGRLFVQVLGCLGEFEKALLRERTMMGLEHARSLGKRLGRPPHGKDDAIRALRAKGYSHRQIARELGISTAAVSRAMANRDTKSPPPERPKGTK